MTDVLNNITVLILRPQHGGNVGLAARGMKNTGLSRLGLVRSKKLQAKATRVMGAPAKEILEQAKEFGSLPDALGHGTFSVGFTRRAGRMRLPVRPFLEIIPEILRHAKKGKVHLVFGNERTGLTSAELGACDTAAYLPANPAFASMNLSHAVMLAGYELLKATLNPEALGGVAKPRAERYPTREAMDALFVEIRAMLRSLDYRDMRRLKLLSSIVANARRMSKRTMPTLSELNMLRGILSRIRQRLPK